MKVTQNEPYPPAVRDALDQALLAARGAHKKATARVWRQAERIRSLEAMLEADPFDPPTESIRSLLVARAMANDGVLKRADAARQMAAIYPSWQAANKALLAALRRSPEFQQVGVDVWRYTEPPPSSPF